MKDLDNISLLDIMPDSIAGDGDVKAAAAAIDKQLRAVSGATDAPAIYANLDNLTGAILDSLAVQYDVTVWRDTWADSIKRNVLKTAISDKRKKGSVYAVKNALASLGAAASISEWFEYNGAPHTFKIYVAQSEIPGHVASEVQEDVISLVDDAKPVRSHYDLIVQQPITGGLNFCGYIRAASYSRVYTNGVMQEDAAAAMGLGVYARAQVVRRLVGEVFVEFPPAPPPAPPIEEFGEIIPVFFSTNGVDSPQIDLRYADAPAYDEAGNPVYLEEGWIYQSSEKEWHYTRMTTNVLTTIYTFPNVSYAMASLTNKTAGSAVQIYTSDHIDALGAYLFRAKEPFYFAWLKANGAGDTTSVNAGSSVPLYYKGSMDLMGYSKLSPLKLRAAIGKTAEYLDISTLEIVQKDTYYAYLKNNGAEAVDVYCLIFSD